MNQPWAVCAALLNVGPIGNDGPKEHDQRATPDQGTAMPTGGLAGREEHDRLMETVEARAHIAPPMPCPSCGLTADNGVLVLSELTTTATYLCTEAHIFSVMWIEDVS